MLAAGLFLGVSAHAGNVLVNPGFEADGGFGNNGTPPSNWHFNGAAAYWIDQVPSAAHSGNNYYKVWGLFNGSPNTSELYQDKSSIATATYQADGWMTTIPTDSMWSGDGVNVSWYEVSFRNSSGTVLTKYRSDLFSSTNYTTGVWYDLPVTNQVDPTSGAVIGSAATLVAPAGTATVRYSVKYYQLQYGGGSCYFDDVTLNQLSGPQPPVLSNVYPGNMLLASNRVSFTASSPSGTAISTNGITLTVNGNAVSSGIAYTINSASSISVLYTNISLNAFNQSASVTVVDNLGLSASTSMAFDTLSSTFVWEAEDYDFTNGLYYDNPTPTSVQAANSYFNVTGTLGVDYSSAGSAGQAHYRLNDTTGTGTASDGARQKFLTAQLTDSNATDWVVGYVADGDWFNYTRDIPAGTYNIYARLASGAGGPNTVQLDDYTTGSPNTLGTFTVANTGWGTYAYYKLTDVDGNLLSFNLSGKKTFRASLVTGGANFNFFMLVPAAPAVPTFTGITPTNSAMFYNGSLTFTANSSGGINLNGVHVYLNGADVTSGLTIGGTSTSRNVSYSALLPNTQYTALLAVTNASGVGTTRTITFDTMNSTNFYVAFADFDYSSGQYNSGDNGLNPGGYIGNTVAVDGIDFHHTTVNGEQFAYRTGLPTQNNTDYSDTFLPQYNIGWFGYNDWGNYTRNYPAGTYLIYGRIAGYNQADPFDLVTSGQGTSTQTLKHLGSFVANPGGWATWQWVPLTDDGGVLPQVVKLGGVQTLRLTSGNNCNGNYFMLVPVTAITASVSRNGNGVAVSFPTVLGKTYQVFSTTSLVGGTWTLVGTTAGTGSTKSVADTTSTQRYYKVVGM